MEGCNRISCQDWKVTQSVQQTEENFIQSSMKLTMKKIMWENRWCNSAMYYLKRDLVNNFIA